MLARLAGLGAGTPGEGGDPRAGPRDFAGAGGGSLAGLRTREQKVGTRRGVGRRKSGLDPGARAVRRRVALSEGWRAALPAVAVGCPLGRGPQQPGSSCALSPFVVTRQTCAARILFAGLRAGRCVRTGPAGRHHTETDIGSLSQHPPNTCYVQPTVKTLLVGNGHPGRRGKNSPSARRERGKQPGGGGVGGRGKGT